MVRDGTAGQVGGWLGLRTTGKPTAGCTNERRNRPLCARDSVVKALIQHFTLQVFAYNKKKYPFLLDSVTH